MSRMSFPIQILGIPATYSTAGEKGWKAALQQSILPCSGKVVQGITMEFSLPLPTSENREKDIDNLCEPVFSVVAGSLDWFRGSRPNIKWWRATKDYTQPYGLDLVMESEAPSKMANEFGRPFFDEVYSGELPFAVKGIKDIPFIEWLKKKSSGVIQSNCQFAVCLRFGGTDVNIGEIPTGTVKRVIDCLSPIIGTNRGHSNDRLVSVLQVEKDVSELSTGILGVCVWEIADITV